MAKEKLHKTNAARLLDEAGLAYELITYEHNAKDPVDGISVAAKLNEPVEKVYKTLVTHHGNEYFVFMIPVDQELDLKKAAKAAGQKQLEMLPLKDLTKITGYIRGGCSPLGMKKDFPVYVEELVQLEDDFYFSAGKIGMQIHMKPQDFLAFRKAKAVALIRED